MKYPIIFINFTGELNHGRITETIRASPASSSTPRHLPYEPLPLQEAGGSVYSLAFVPPAVRSAMKRAPNLRTSTRALNDIGGVLGGANYD